MSEKNVNYIKKFDTINFGEYDDEIRNLVKLIPQLYTWHYSILGLMRIALTYSNDKHKNMPFFTQLVDFSDLEKNSLFNEMNIANSHALSLLNQIAETPDTENYIKYMSILEKFFDERTNSMLENEELVDDIDGILFIVEFAHSLAFHDILPENNIKYYFENWAMFESLLNMDTKRF